MKRLAMSLVMLDVETIALGRLHYRQLRWESESIALCEVDAHDERTAILGGSTFQKLDLDPKALARLLEVDQFLSEEQIEQSKLKSDPLRRFQFLIARALETSLKTNRVLEKGQGLPCAYSSVSHSEWLIATALSWHRKVGIDIQNHTAVNYKAIAQRVFREKEGDRLQDGRVEDFFEIWAAKEALLKCSGEKLLSNLPSLLEILDSDEILVKLRGYEYKVISFRETCRSMNMPDCSFVLSVRI